MGSRTEFREVDIATQRRSFDTGSTRAQRILPNKRGLTTEVGSSILAHRLRSAEVEMKATRQHQSKPAEQWVTGYDADEPQVSFLATASESDDRRNSL